MAQHSTFGRCMTCVGHASTTTTADWVAGIFESSRQAAPILRNCVPSACLAAHCPDSPEHTYTHNKHTTPRLLLPSGCILSLILSRAMRLAPSPTFACLPPLPPEHKTQFSAAPACPAVWPPLIHLPTCPPPCPSTHHPIPTNPRFPSLLMSLTLCFVLSLTPASLPPSPKAPNTVLSCPLPSSSHACYTVSTELTYSHIPCFPSHLEPDDALCSVPDLGADDLRVSFILELVVETLPRTLIRIRNSHLNNRDTRHVHTHGILTCAPRLFECA